MYKLKTSKSVRKRFKILSGCKVLRRRSCRNHLLQKKASKRKQKLRKVLLVSQVDLLNFKFKIPYIY
uniref:Large ribosomal subunit protein bL35c n=1 Tax=Melanthalia intermedia TaxID=172989 RepID=A0A345UAS9_9FLOR|nr:ribosomal protein L35 [Melanthalia intermedia]AXI97565.1 ribosomal protein L35 [Melanthalia intermedia]